MKQSLSWIDRDELWARLGDLTSTPSAHPLVELARPQHEAPAPRPAAPPPPPAPAPAPPAPVATDAVALFNPPAGSIQTKLEAFLRWAGPLLGSERLFLADQEGLCLAPRDVEPELMGASAWLMTVWEKVQRLLGRPGGGTGTFELVHGEGLLLVVARAPWGLCGMGAVVDALPAPSVLAQVRVSLLAVLNPSENGT